MDKFERLNWETKQYNERNVSRRNLHSQFLGASGSRQTGYYYSPSNQKNSGGEWKQSGSGAWYKD